MGKREKRNSTANAIDEPQLQRQKVPSKPVEITGEWRLLRRHLQ